MARSFNYSKWDNIELSDDESDLHPNIDKVCCPPHHPTGLL
jgi:cell division cycle protein 37